MIKRPAAMKRPLLASGWPAVRLTLARRGALMGEPQTAGPVRGVALAAGRVPDRRHWPISLQPRPSVAREAAGESADALKVRGGLMGNFAMVDSGQEQHLRAL